MKKSLFFIFIYICLAITSANAQLAREDILYIKPNGQDYLYYTTIRSNGYSFSKIIPRSNNILKKYLYINPERFKIKNNARNTRLEFGTESYALMSEERFSNKEIKVGDKGVMTYSNDTIPSWRGKQRYGIYTTLRYFKQFAYVWVLPENFEFVSYKSNREGKWTRRGNTLAYFGYQVNNLFFDIKFRPVSQLTLENVKSTLYQANSKGMAVTSNAKGVQINFRKGILFSKSTTSLSSLGESILAKLSKTLKTSLKVRLAMAVPVDKGLDAGRWMLASARGRIMVEKLIDNGIDPSRIEVKTFGVKPNEVNKGIEIQLINAPKRKQ